MRALIEIGDRLFAFEPVLFSIQPHRNVVVDLLLPVVGPWRPRSEPDFVGGRKEIIDLAKWIGLVLPSGRFEPRVIVEFPLLVVRGKERRWMGRKNIRGHHHAHQR